jgi:hypothetical protein
MRNTAFYQFSASYIEDGRTEDYNDGVAAGEGEIIEILRRILRNNKV